MMKRNIRLTQKLELLNQKLELLARKRVYPDYLQRFSKTRADLDFVKEFIEEEKSHELGTEIFTHVPKEPVCMYYEDLECKKHIENYINNLNDKNADFYIMQDISICDNNVEPRIPILLVNRKDLIEFYDIFIKHTGPNDLTFCSKDLKQGLFIQSYASHPFDLFDNGDVYECFEWA